MEFRYMKPLLKGPGVLDIQLKLNQARAKAVDLLRNDTTKPQFLMNQYYFQQIHHRNTIPNNWSTISTDGIYGLETEKAVKGFQSFLFITENGIMGDMTYASLLNLLSIDTTRASQINTPQITKAPIEVDHFNAWSLPDNAIGTLIDFTNSIRTLVCEVTTMKGTPTPTKIFQFFRKPLEAIDPQMRKLHQQMNALTSYINRSNVSAATSATANRPIATNKGTDLKVLDARQQVRTADANRRMAIKTTKEISSIKTQITNQIQRYDIGCKIKTWFNKTRMNPPKATGAKLKVGGALGFIWTFKTVLWDLRDLIPVYTGERTLDSWWANFKKDLFEAIDSLIIGLISTFLAEALVAAGAAAIGASGPIIVVVAIVVFILAMIIGLLISWLLDEADFSFSRFIYDGCRQMIIDAATAMHLAW